MARTALLFRWERVEPCREAGVVTFGVPPGSGWTGVRALVAAELTLSPLSFKTLNLGAPCPGSAFLARDGEKVSVAERWEVGRGALCPRGRVLGQQVLACREGVCPGRGRGPDALLQRLMGLHGQSGRLGRDSGLLPSWYHLPRPEPHLCFCETHGINRLHHK